MYDNENRALLSRLLSLLRQFKSLEYWVLNALELANQHDIYTRISRIRDINSKIQYMMMFNQINAWLDHEITFSEMHLEYNQFIRIEEIYPLFQMIYASIHANEIIDSVLLIESLGYKNFDLITACHISYNNLKLEAELLAKVWRVSQVEGGFPVHLDPLQHTFISTHKIGLFKRNRNFTLGWWM